MGSVSPGVGRKQLLKTSASISSIATIWVLRVLGEGISSGQPQGRTERLSAPHYPRGAGREQGLPLGHLSSLLPPWVRPHHGAKKSHPNLVTFIHLCPSNNSFSYLEKMPLNSSAEMSGLPQPCAGTKTLEVAQSSFQAGSWHNITGFLAFNVWRSAELETRKMLFLNRQLFP